ncbi:MAG TPA: hypothetical protein VJS65_00975 [Verrucomicrobiae bacterium]|nr:hypothetical protein [Verrucomicrobiae bacterium]
MAIIKTGTETHWSLGIAATLFVAYATHLGVSDLRSPQARRFPIQKGVGIACLTAFSAIAVAASASLLLLGAGWALYDPTPPANRGYDPFITYYLWVLLDMLPGLQVNELLTFAPPLKPKNAVAGIPVIAFRTFVLLGLLKTLKVWWEGRKNGTRKSSTSYELALIIR